MSVLSATVVSGLLLFLVVWLSVETIRHRRSLTRIPVRIHVNGTRGKSSVTRLLAAGLGAGDKRVVAKTTGTLARVILPGEGELAVYRPLGANIREQIRIVRFAAERNADVLILECMALQPILQWLSEKVFVRATHGVITNARPDHLDVMGPTGDDVAKALAGMMPRGRECFTCEREKVHHLRAAAKDRSSTLRVVSQEAVAALDEAALEGFRHVEHAENVALALEVCDALGVPKERALAGMKSGTSDPGALAFHKLDFFGRELVFVNAFAANDPVSSQHIWEMCLERFPEHERICIINCREDRADRSQQLGVALGSWSKPDQVVLVGSGTVFFARAARRTGLGVGALHNAEGLDARDAFERIVDVASSRAVLVGLGNIGGLGLDLARLFRNRGTMLLPSELTRSDKGRDQVDDSR